MPLRRYVDVMAAHVLRPRASSASAVRRRDALLGQLAVLTDAELRAIGVAHPGHRKRLLIAASKIEIRLECDDSTGRRSSSSSSCSPMSEHNSPFTSSNESESASPDQHGELARRRKAASADRPVAAPAPLLLPEPFIDSGQRVTNSLAIGQSVHFGVLAPSHETCNERIVLRVSLSSAQGPSGPALPLPSPLSRSSTW
jgi:hypothetical protein